MTQSSPHVDDIRAAVREVCGKYGDAYWRGLDRERAYPEEFVREMTELGWLAALVPEQYGGGGMSVAEACVILEEINRSGRARRLLPRPDVYDGSAASSRQRGAEGALPARRRRRQSPAASVRGHGAGRGLRDDAHPDHGDTAGRPVRRQRSEGLHLPGAAVGPYGAAGPDDALRRARRQDAGPVRGSW